MFKKTPTVDSVVKTIIDAIASLETVEDAQLTLAEKAEQQAKTLLNDAAIATAEAQRAAKVRDRLVDLIAP